MASASNVQEKINPSEIRETENGETDQMSRRSFLKLGLTATIGTMVMGALPEIADAVEIDLSTTERMRNYKLGQQTPSICVYCAGGCGILVTSLGGKIIETEGDPYHPINEGALCSKASAFLQFVNNDRRILHPMKRTNPKKGKDENPGWVPISWDEAFTIIASKVREALKGVTYKRPSTVQGKFDYYHIGKESPIAWLGSSYWNNEECYLAKKFISLLGSANVEHQARKCHASTVVGLANTFGFGAMTNHIIDAKNSKCFLIVSNPAESHSMEFRWVTRAIDNGAKVIVLDPRFNRTGAKADIYVRCRSGSEAAIFLGLIRYILFEKPNRVDWTFLENRTNAPYTIEGVGPLPDWKENQDSIFGRLKALVERYTPEEVEKVSGIPRAKLVEIAETFSANKPGNIYYSMGTTQHTNATQAIRAHAILQLLLGNMGVPGGGVNALRGISNVQGSTDMSLLSHLIMGYRAPPITVEEIRRYQKWKNGGGPGTSGNKDADAVTRGGTTDPRRVTYPWEDISDAEAKASVDKFRYDDRHFPTWNALEYHWGTYVGTWPGVDPDNEPVVCDLPVGTGNAIVQLFRAIHKGTVKVLFCNAENPAVSVANVNFVREALSKEGLFTVVNELFETETAVYADILLPGSVVAERSGSITNTGRWIQWRWKSVDPPGKCKPDLQYVTELFWNVRRALKDASIKLPSEKFEDESGNKVMKLVGGVAVENDPDVCWPSRFGKDAESVYKEICAKSIKVGTVTLPQSAANVLYRNGYDPDLRPDLDGILAKRRDNTPADAEDAAYGYYKNWAYSWMLNQRVLYNITESKRGVATFFVWFAISPNVWVGRTLDKAAIFSKPLFIKKPDGTSYPEWHPWKHGFPLHNEPLEAPDSQLTSLYPTMFDHTNVTDVVWFDTASGKIMKGKSEEIGKGDFPHVLTTFRLAEHMQAGALTRNLPWLVECHPEVFVEISPAFAAEIGVKSGDYVRIKTARNRDGVIVKANVTERIQPLMVNSRTVHEVAMPWHWGFKGLSTGVSANELTIDAVDVSANIPEYKVCLCKVEKV